MLLTNEKILAICENDDDATKGFQVAHTMYRIKDPKRTIPFYTGVLGMKLLLKGDFPHMNFSLYFFGYEDPAKMPGSLSSLERIRWTLARKAVVELTHNWGTEDDPDFEYHNGNLEPRGYGHIAIMVPDVEKSCARFEKLGVKFFKKPQEGTMKGFAFIEDPDGYRIEIFNNDETANSA